MSLQPVRAALLDLPHIPLTSGTGVELNIMLIFDNSGSMKQERLITKVAIQSGGADSADSSDPVSVSGQDCTKGDPVAQGEEEEEEGGSPPVAGPPCGTAAGTSDDWYELTVVWKGLLSADFLDGTFFYYTFLTDSRFYDLGRWLSGMNPAIAQYNQTVLRELATSATVDVDVQLQSPAYLWTLAKGITWWTLGIESAIAALCLCPIVRQAVRFRHVCLLLFAWTTYLVATVETFGLLLMILGLAQCEPSQRYTRWLYLATFGLIMVYDQLPLLSFLPPMW